MKRHHKDCDVSALCGADRQLFTLLQEITA